MHDSQQNNGSWSTDGATKGGSRGGAIPKKKKKRINSFYDEKREDERDYLL